MTKHLFPYKWKLSNGYQQKRNNLNVFGTFICGGGSTMGYKLAGYNCLGGVEIDPKIADLYKKNHNPKYLYVEDIREFNKRTDLPKELYNLDLLDGSPPCSTFSMAGSREKAWQKEKKFTEGQALQTLDDLFFDYIALAVKLKPKVVVAENVKGIIQGNAKAYTYKIKAEFEKAGYVMQIFLFNAASMGVPQRRERVFFIGHKKALQYPKLNMLFMETPVLYKEIEDDVYEHKIVNCDLQYFDKCKAGRRIASVHPKGNSFNSIKLHKDKVCNTIVSRGQIYHYCKHKALSNNELCLAGSFPVDYKFLRVPAKYIIGMSVPPIMMAQISNQIAVQWFNKKGAQYD